MCHGTTCQCSWSTWALSHSGSALYWTLHVILSSNHNHVNTHWTSTWSAAYWTAHMIMSVLYRRRTTVKHPLSLLRLVILTTQCVSVSKDGVIAPRSSILANLPEHHCPCRSTWQHLCHLLPLLRWQQQWDHLRRHLSWICSMKKAMLRPPTASRPLLSNILCLFQWPRHKVTAFEQHDDL